MSDLTLRQAVRHEHDVRRTRDEVRLLDEAVAAAGSNRERTRARARAAQARPRLVRALLRRLLPPGPETDTFVARVEGALREARFAPAVLDDLAAALDTIPSKEEPDGRT